MTEEEELHRLLTTLSLTLAFHPKDLYALKRTSERLLAFTEFPGNISRLRRLRSSVGSIRMFKSFLKEMNDPLLLLNAENYG